MPTDSQHLDIFLRLLYSMIAGGVIGLERSYHARPAGFRTHTLVCLATASLMLVTVYQWQWMPNAQLHVQTDPTRMAQGIMTGIGFLGAGVIFKDGLSVRGLTTAASIWVTAVIGILIGAGMEYAAALGTVLTLGVLSMFRFVENRMPAHSYVHSNLRFERHEVMDEQEVRDLLASHGFKVTLMSYRAADEGDAFEYRLVMRTRDPSNAGRLAITLREMRRVRSFRISPTGD